MNDTNGDANTAEVEAIGRAWEEEEAAEKTDATRLWNEVDASDPYNACEATCAPCSVRGLDPDATPHGFDHDSTVAALAVFYVWIPDLMDRCARVTVGVVAGPETKMGPECDPVVACLWRETDPERSSVSSLRAEYPQKSGNRKLFRLRTPVRIKTGGSLAVYGADGLCLTMRCKDPWKCGEFVACSDPWRNAGMCGWSVPADACLEQVVAARAAALLYDAVCAYMIMDNGSDHARRIADAIQSYYGPFVFAQEQKKPQRQRQEIKELPMPSMQPAFRRKMGLLPAQSDPFPFPVPMAYRLYTSDRCELIRRASDAVERDAQDLHILVHMRQAEQTFEPLATKEAARLADWFQEVWNEARLFGECWLLRNLPIDSPRPWHLPKHEIEDEPEPERLGWSSYHEYEPFSQKLYRLLSASRLPDQGIACILDCLSPQRLHGIAAN
jgi:hypothetical protein